MMYFKMYVTGGCMSYYYTNNYYRNDCKNDLILCKKSYLPYDKSSTSLVSIDH